MEDSTKTVKKVFDTVVNISRKIITLKKHSSDYEVFQSETKKKKK